MAVRDAPGGKVIARLGTRRRSGTPDPVGGTRSAGCLRAANDDMVLLFARVPLGAPVFIHAWRAATSGPGYESEFAASGLFR